MTLNADALIIGIDRYDRDDFPVLPGCVNDAVAAAKWLIEIGVPPERIIAHISPLDPTRFPGGVIVLAAKDRAIRASFTKLSKSGHGDKLFFFMSGHGKSVPGAGPVFLCQDYLVDGSTRENLKVEEYIEWFQSWRYRDQFLFYDACQDATASVGQLSNVQASGPDPQPGTYKPDPTVSFTACYACSPGERAWAGDGRGVLIRYSLEELDLKFWEQLQSDDPEQDAVQYDWTTGTRVVDLSRLFTNNIAGKITQAANSGQKFQTPFCRSHGRALVDGFSPILELPPLPTTTLNVDVDPQLAVGEVQSIRLQSQVIPRACFIPSKNTPLKIPVTLKFPLQDQINAGCRLAPKSTWAAVNVPLLRKLENPNVDIIFQFRQPPPDSPSSDDGKDEINIIVDPGHGGDPLPAEIAKHLGPDGEIGGAKLPPGLTLRKDASGPTIIYHRNDSGLIFDANRIAIDWVKLLRRSNLGKEERILLSTAGQPKNVHPNVRFDFGKSSAAVLGGFLESHECVTLESFSNEMPERAMSLRDLENHPLEWLDPGQYRMTIDLPWGRWTKRFRVGDRFDVVALPQAIGLEPLRNRFRSHDVFDPGLTRYYQLFGIRKSDGFHVWGTPATGVPIASIETECGIRAEPFSKTSLREWDGLLTVGRLDIDDPAGFIRKLDGKVPDGTDEDFGLLALAAAYAAYDQESWPDLRTIIEIIDERAFNFFDVSLLKLAADVADGRLVERKQVIIDHLAYPHDYNPLPWLSPTEILGRTPILRWGVTLLQYLARQVNLPPPPWVYEIDLSSVVTLFNFDRWELSEEFWTKHAPIPEYLLPPGLLPSQSDLEKKA